MTHLQARRQAPPPGGHTRFIPLVHIPHPQRDQMIQHLVSLQLRNPSLILKMSRLNGSPPQEVLVVEIVHGVVNVTHPLTIKPINDGGVLGVPVNDILMRVRVVSLVSVRDRHFMDTIGVLGDSRHGDR